MKTVFEHNWSPFSNSIYRMSIKSFPDYKHLLQESYVEHKHATVT